MWVFIYDNKMCNSLIIPSKIMNFVDIHLLEREFITQWKVLLTEYIQEDKTVNIVTT